MIARYLGTPVGEIPQMRRDLFRRLKKSQDFFEKKKRKRDTHFVLVNPAALKITVGPDRPLTLDASGTLTEVPASQRDGIVPGPLTVPLSLKNLQIPAANPLAGRQHLPVFDPESDPEVLRQCNTPPERTGILIIRKGIVGRGRLLEDQIALPARYGWGIVTIRERALHNVIRILQTGICSDIQNRYSHVSSAESFFDSGFQYRSVIGPPDIGRYLGPRTDFRPELYLVLYNDLAHPCVGVAPAIDATASESSPESRK